MSASATQDGHNYNEIELHCDENVRLVTDTQCLLIFIAGSYLLEVSFICLHLKFFSVVIRSTCVFVCQQQ